MIRVATPPVVALSKRAAGAVGQGHAREPGLAVVKQRGQAAGPDGDSREPVGGVVGVGHRGVARIDGRGELARESTAEPYHSQFSA